MHQDTVTGTDGGAGDPAVSRLAREIRLRALPAVILAALAVGIDFAGVVPFAALVAAVGLVMCWEWGRLVRFGDRLAVLVVHGLAVVGAVTLAALGHAALALVVLVMAAIAVVPLSLGRGARLSALGVLYVGLPTVALVWLRSDEPWGAVAVLLVLVSVWAMDTAALIGGKLIGGPRMWPSVSPNKTWAGLVSGLVASTSAGALFGAALMPGAIPGLMAVGFLLGLVSQGGDLVESAIKRHFAVKNTSNLIPGHGGFLDRLDGAVAAAVAAALLAALVDVSAPARALLFGH